MTGSDPVTTPMVKAESVCKNFGALKVSYLNGKFLDRTRK